MLKSGNIFLDPYVENLHNAKYAKSIRVRWWVNQRITCPSQVEPSDCCITKTQEFGNFSRRFSRKLPKITTIEQFVNDTTLHQCLHYIGLFSNLRLLRILGSFLAERFVDAVSNQLNEFEIEFEAGIIAVTTLDGSRR